MAKNQFSLFATKNDLWVVLNDAASKFLYVFSYLDEDGVPIVCNSPDEIEDLGVMSVGDQNQTKIYLLIDPSEQPRTRSVEQRGRGVKTFYDQMSHPESVSFRPGGVLSGPSCIIAGQVGTVSDDSWSIALYKAIVSSVKKGLSK